MKALEKNSKKSLVSKVAVCIFILLLANVANSYTRKEIQPEHCLTKECSNLNPNDEIENAMQATAANIHLWSGNRSYKGILKAIIISSAENQVQKIVEINHHLLATSLDVGNLRMARESASIINRFAPESMARFNQASLLSDGTPALTLFQRLNSRTKFSDQEMDLINSNFHLKNNEYQIEKGLTDEENSAVGEAFIVDSIYNLSNDGTGEVSFFSNKAGNRTNTLFSRIQAEMSQLSYSKKLCNLQYIGKVQMAILQGLGAGASAGGTVGAVIGGPPGAVIGATVGGIAGMVGYKEYTEDIEKVEREKCKDGAEDPAKQKDSKKDDNSNDENKEDDENKKHLTTDKTTESPNADLHDTSTSSTSLVDLLSDYYNTINFRQFDKYNNPLTTEQIELKIDSVTNFGNKESDGHVMTATELAQRQMQRQEKWTTPAKPLKQSIR